MELDQLQQQATNASSQAADLSAKAPSLLNQLKTNLNNLFAKDIANPLQEGSLGQARAQTLADYLSTPARARAEFLPSNLPNVEGSPLNLSPTQQNAIVQSRESAALAPLAGLNQIITGLYGNVPGAIQGASDLYRGQIEAAQNKASLAQQQFENAFKRAQFAEGIRQFNVSQASKGGLSASEKKDIRQIESNVGGLAQQIKKIQEAREFIQQNSGKNISGTGPTFLRGIRRGGALGGVTAESSQLESKLSEINEGLFEVAGKAFTGAEKGLLQGKILEMGNDETLLIDQLNQLEASARRAAIFEAQQLDSY